MPAATDKPRAVRLRQAGALLAGAVAVELLVGVGPLEFHWVPLIVGVAYLVAAALGGRSGGHWATAIVVVAFGATVALISEASTGINPPAGYLLGSGLGAMLAAYLGGHGFSADALGIAGAVTGVGLFLFLADDFPDALGRGEAYAILLALVGAVNLVLALRGPTRGVVSESEPEGR